MSFIEYFEPSDSIQVGGIGRVGPARNKEVAWLRERQKDISPDERGTIDGGYVILTHSKIALSC